MPNGSVFDESDSFEFFFAQLQQLITASMASPPSETDISEILKFCSQQKNASTPYVTEKYGHIFFSTALLNLTPERAAYLCSNDDFLNLLVKIIHHPSHFLQMYLEIPHEYLFGFFSKIDRSLFYKLRDTDLELNEGLNTEHLELWLLALYGPQKGGTLLIHCPLDFIKSLDKEILFEFIDSSPSKLLLLMRLMPSIEKQKELLNYLNDTFTSSDDIKNISVKKRSPVWYRGANFVMVVLLRPDGYKAFYHGSKKALPAEERLLTGYIRTFKGEIDNGEALATALDLIPGHLQRQFLESVVTTIGHNEAAQGKIRAKHSKINTHAFAELFTNAPFQLNAVLDSLHFQNSKRYFLRQLNDSAPDDNWIDRLYRRGSSAQRALSGLERSSDYGIVTPYLKQKTLDLSTLDSPTGIAHQHQAVTKPIHYLHPRPPSKPKQEVSPAREEVVHSRRIATK